jgi:disulfide bond formation protein DsbB
LGNASIQPAAGTAPAWAPLFAAWLIAAASTLGALYFGEIALCWYQRIFMFPLTLILPFGLFPPDRRIIRAALALAVPGALVASYHLLLASGVIPKPLKPCMQGIPCSETVVQWFGFLTIPLLSAVAFPTIIALLVTAHRRSST